MGLDWGVGLVIIVSWTVMMFFFDSVCTPILCDPIDGSQPGSPVSWILQARTLEWVAISFSNAWKWKVKVKSLWSCPTLRDPMDCSFPGSSIHGIFQARVLEWSAIDSVWDDIKYRDHKLLFVLKKNELLNFCLYPLMCCHQKPHWLFTFLYFACEDKV